MAIYSLSVSKVSRANNGSSVASAAYATRSRMRDERTGELYNYQAQEDLVCSSVILPAGAPEIYKDPERLCNSLEMYEKSETAQVAKKVIVALPREFDRDLQVKVIEDFISKNFTKNHYAAIYAIHDKGDGNPHAHIIVPSRQISKTGEWEQIKERKVFARDELGNKIPVLDKDGNQAYRERAGHGKELLWKRVWEKTNPIETLEFLKEIRKDWADQCNRFLEKEQQIDHRSLEDQGIERIPTIHEGYAAREIERKGGISDRCQENREIKEHNNWLEKAMEKIHELQQELRNLFAFKSREDKQIEKERERERAQRAAERAEYEKNAAYVKADIQRDPLDRLLERMQKPKNPAIEKLRDELNDIIINYSFEGLPVPDRYYELNKIINDYDERQNLQIEAIEEGMEKGLSGEDLYEYTMQRMPEIQQENALRLAERELERDEEEWER